MDNGAGHIEGLREEVARLHLELCGHHLELRIALEDGMARGAFDYSHIQQTRDDIKRTLVDLTREHSRLHRLTIRAGLRILPPSLN